MESTKEKAERELYETTNKIAKPLYAFSDLKKHTKQGKILETTFEYLKQKYYKGLLL